MKSGGRKASAPKQLALRISAELLARVDAYVERIRQENPALNLNRSDALRLLITECLDRKDQEQH